MNITNPRSVTGQKAQACTGVSPTLPTCNRSKLTRHALESVLAQGYAHAEVSVVGAKSPGDAAAVNQDTGTVFGSAEISNICQIIRLVVTHSPVVRARLSLPIMVTEPVF